MQLNALGTPGVGYRVQGHTNLSTTEWLNLGTVMADGDGLVQFLDKDSLWLPSRCYRLVAP